MPADRLLLDTCAFLGLHGIQPISPSAVAEVARVGKHGALVSPITAWEIAARCRFKPKPSFAPIMRDPVGWFARRMATPAFALTALTPEIAFHAYALPEPFHRDPGDRMLVATARLLGCPIITSDAKILAYAAAGHVQAIAS